jgi:hypothetical protein
MMMLLLQVVLAVLLLRALIQTGLGLLQIAMGLAAGVVAAAFYCAATLLHWLVLLFQTAFPRQN